jgi:hypothetical protein
MNVSDGDQTLCPHHDSVENDYGKIFDLTAKSDLKHIFSNEGSKVTIPKMNMTNYVPKHNWGRFWPPAKRDQIKIPSELKLESNSPLTSSPYLKLGKEFREKRQAYQIKPTTSYVKQKYLKNSQASSSPSPNSIRNLPNLTNNPNLELFSKIGLGKFSHRETPEAEEGTETLNKTLIEIFSNYKNNKTDEKYTLVRKVKLGKGNEKRSKSSQPTRSQIQTPQLPLIEDQTLEKKLLPSENFKMNTINKGNTIYLQTRPHPETTSNSNSQGQETNFNFSLPPTDDSSHAKALFPSQNQSPPKEKEKDIENERGFHKEKDKEREKEKSKLKGQCRSNTSPLKKKLNNEILISSQNSTQIQFNNMHHFPDKKPKGAISPRLLQFQAYNFPPKFNVAYQNNHNHQKFPLEIKSLSNQTQHQNKSLSKCSTLQNDILNNTHAVSIENNSLPASQKVAADKMSVGFKGNYINFEDEAASKRLKLHLGHNQPDKLLKKGALKLKLNTYRNQRMQSKKSRQFAPEKNLLKVPPLTKKRIQLHKPFDIKIDNKNITRTIVCKDIICNSDFYDRHTPKPDFDNAPHPDTQLASIRKIKLHQFPRESSLNRLRDFSGSNSKASSQRNTLHSPPYSIIPTNANHPNNQAISDTQVHSHYPLIQNHVNPEINKRCSGTACSKSPLNSIRNNNSSHRNSRISVNHSLHTSLQSSPNNSRRDLKTHLHLDDFEFNRPQTEYTILVTVKQKKRSPTHKRFRPNTFTGNSPKNSKFHDNSPNHADEVQLKEIKSRKINANQQFAYRNHDTQKNDFSF